MRRCLGSRLAVRSGCVRAVEHVRRPRDVWWCRRPRFAPVAAFGDPRPVASVRDLMLKLSDELGDRASLRCVAGADGAESAELTPRNKGAAAVVVHHSTSEREAQPWLMVVDHVASPGDVDDLAQVLDGVLAGGLTLIEGNGRSRLEVYLGGRRCTRVRVTALPCSYLLATGDGERRCAPMSRTRDHSRRATESGLSHSRRCKGGPRSPRLLIN